MEFTQQHREVEIFTPLGSDVLLLKRMTMREALGRLFEIELELFSTQGDIAFEDVLGQNVTIRVVLPDDNQRYFNGFVSRFSQSADQGSFFVYQASVRPWFWFLTRTTDCRIFQQQTTPDIIKDVFRELGFTNFEEKLSGSYPNREYCVQYRETDFNFVSRLMEEEGIYYYFEHQDGKHTMILADGYGSHEPISNYEELTYYPPDDTSIRDEECVNSWSLVKQVQPGAYVHDDFDFKRPKLDLAADSATPKEHDSADFEIYDYPGEYLEVEEGSTYARTRLEEFHAKYEMANGESDARGLYSGGLFSLAGYPRDDQNREYLIVRIDHQIVSDEFESGRSEGRAVYTNRFRAIDSKTAFRPARITSKSVVRGPQTAIVVGPAGEEIHTDEFGRVKLQFHWDRYGKSDENSSCWVRVSQLWAGKTWGGIHIPRIGQEVIVEFLEGDPDRPIITGRVYNAEQMPPYDLPSNKTQSGIKSRSSKGGSGANFNEIRMEDKKGEEEFYLHAEKNHTNITENDRNEDVGHDRSLHVGHDKSEAIDNNKSITVAVNHDETIGSNKTLSVGVNHDEKIGSMKTLAVGANHTESIGANMSITIGANLTETVAINYAETVGVAMELTIGAGFAETVGAGKAQTIGSSKEINIGANKSENVGSSKSVSVGKSLSESIGDSHSESVAKDYSLSAKTVTVQAQDSITLKTGKASITMKKDGTIQIRGKDISVNGSGKINVKASGNIKMKGKKILEN